MVAYCKMDMGMATQTAFIMDGTTYEDTFTYTAETIAQDIDRYCANNGTLNEIVLMGNPNFLAQYKLAIEQQGILNYANKPIKVTIQGE